MSKRNSIEEIKKLFTLDYAQLSNNIIYKNRHSKLDYVCRYGEYHTTTLADWQRGRRCSCFKEWEDRLYTFNSIVSLLLRYGAKIKTSFSEDINAYFPVEFINCNNELQKIPINHLKMCDSLFLKKEDIMLLYNENVKQTDISKKFNIPQYIISACLRLWGINNSDSNRFIRVDLNRELLYTKYWEEQKHPATIAKEFGCSKYVVINNMRRYNIPFRTKSESRLGELNPIYNVGHSEEAKKKMSQAFVNGRKIGYHTSWGKTSKYNTPNQGIVTMRSMWEVRVADYLTEIGKDWFYEYKTFKLTNTISYRPDFYIPEDSLYIEVKGRLLDSDLLKLELFESLGFTILLWDSAELQRLNLIDHNNKIIYND